MESLIIEKATARVTVLKAQRLRQEEPHAVSHEGGRRVSRQEQARRRRGQRLCPKLLCAGTDLFREG